MAVRAQVGLNQPSSLALRGNQGVGSVLVSSLSWTVGHGFDHGVEHVDLQCSNILGSLSLACGMRESTLASRRRGVAPERAAWVVPQICHAKGMGSLARSTQRASSVFVAAGRGRLLARRRVKRVPSHVAAQRELAGRVLTPPTQRQTGEKRTGKTSDAPVCQGADSPRGAAHFLGMFVPRVLQLRRRTMSL